MIDLSKVCEQVVNLSKEVGEFIACEFQNFDRNTVEEKERNSLVSYVDKEAERKLVDALSIIFPEAGFIAEEGTGERKENGYNWLVDPLDGTTNFVHGIPVFAVSIALIDANQVAIVGVVYEINLKECFYAFQNGGAFLNGKRISVSDTLEIGNSVFATGFPYFDHTKMPQYLRLLSVMMQKIRGFRRMGSAAVDLAYTAAGRFDIYLEHQLSPWDVAAGACIVKEAGGIVCDFEGGGDYIFGKQILASNNKLNPKVLKILQKHFWINS